MFRRQNRLCVPAAIAVDYAGRVLLLDAGESRLHAFDKNGHRLPIGHIAVGPNSLRVNIDQNRGDIMVFEQSGAFLKISANTRMPRTYEWTPDKHRFAPLAIRTAVNVFTRIRSLGHDSVLALLPNELLFLIFQHL